MYKALVLLGALLLSAGAALAQEPWDEAAYNPQWAGDDEYLPMPCGGTMTFRPILTVTTGDVLQDLRITLGQGGVNDGSENAVSEFLRQEYILGSLSGPDYGGASATIYWIGKYEVTQDQYEAVMSGSCPEPSRHPLPVTDISWFDAVQFTRRYTEWLLQNATEELPTQGDYRAYIRLPTEVEWEYAARGGQTAITDGYFRERLFRPLSEGAPLEDYVWFQGQMSSNGDMKPIGRLEPNPVGLYDILGNVEEFVLDPFRINYVGRRHGQVGGFVTRGGSYLTPRARISNADRQEYSYFDDRTGEARRLPTFGFRVVVSAPILASDERITQLRRAWQEAWAMRTGSESEDPVTEIHNVRELIDNVDLRRRLEDVERQFTRELAARNEVEGRAIRSAIVSGSVLIRMLRNDDRAIRVARQLMDFQCREPDSQDCRERQDQVASMEERFNITARAYFTSLEQLADDYRPNQLREQLAMQTQIFQGSDLNTLVPMADTFISQVLVYADTRELNEDEYLEQILQ
jgi:hypothetical protein